MKNYNCEYENGTLLKINNWKLSVEADDHYHAYKLFLDKAGVQQCRVYVQKGFLDGGMFFDDHMEVEEPEKRIEEQKAETSEHSRESADKENSNFDHPKIDTKLEGISTTSATEKLLLNIALTQEKQFQELKKLNFKLMMFWIFLVVLPLLGWLLTQ